MVSKASEDLPEPESPVRTTSWSRGSSTSMFLRLCSRAPRTMIRSLAIEPLCPLSARLPTAAERWQQLQRRGSFGPARWVGSGGHDDTDRGHQLERFLEEKVRHAGHAAERALEELGKDENHGARG